VVGKSYTPSSWQSVVTTNWSNRLMMAFTFSICYIPSLVLSPLPHMLFFRPWFFIHINAYRFTLLYPALQAKLSIIHDLLGKVHATVVSTEKGQVYRALLDELNAERRQCRSGMRDLFNSSFGATFLTDTGRESSFAYHIHQYADIYTSKLENFLSYAPESWLHPPHDIKIMPHNAKVV
jgi:hypothetical protein